MLSQHTDRNNYCTVFTQRNSICVEKSSGVLSKWFFQKIKKKRIFFLLS